MKSLYSSAALSASLLLTAAGFAAPPKDTISDGVVKIGVLTDMSGVYSARGGKGTQVGVEMAVKDFGGKVLGKPIVVIGADHQNKADIASAKAREWFDNEKVDMITGLLNSGCALAVQKLGGDKKRITMNTGAASTELTNGAWTPYSIHYVYDTYALGKVTGQAVVQTGGKSWFFITADYAFGQSLEGNTALFVKKLGGKVVGSVRHPLSSADFSSYLLQAQASGAQIIGLANAGGDTINAMKAAKEFGITKTMKVAGLLVFINDVHSLGLANTEGLQLADSWYWNQDDGSRKFAKRFFEKYKRMPSSIQAADYSAATTYLKAVQTAGTTDTDKVMSTLKTMKVDDFYNKGQIRADGRMIHDMYLFEVKSSKDSSTPWDYYKTVVKVPGEQAFTSVADSKCALLKK